jgi:polyphosphate kinase 2
VRKKTVGKKERKAAAAVEPSEQSPQSRKLKRKEYETKLDELHMELVKMQYWIKAKGKKLVVLFEGRDAAGKGGAIKCVAEPLNPRGCRIIALGKPSDRENTQWYFQRYVAHLPASGEIVLFDRSWYNRAGVEYVMGFCNQEDYSEFLHSCPEFERMLVRSGIILLKYWFSVSDEEQERRFHERAGNPARRWKMSEMDIQSREKWVEFSKAKDVMFLHTDIKQAPWYTIEADDKRQARLNCIAHILSMVPYKDVTPPPLKLPPRRPPDKSYVRPPKSDQHIVPDVEL